MNWTLIVDKRAKKALRRFPRNDSDKILKAISEFSVNPYAGDVEKMEYEDDVWRRRVGAYRIFYEVHTRTRIIRIYHIERRTSKTY